MFVIPLHQLIVHFPIALAIFAFAYDGWAILAKRSELHDVGYGLSLWAAAASLLSVVTGFQIAGLNGIAEAGITGHALFGLSTAVVLTAFGLWRYSGKARQEGAAEKYSSLWIALQGFAAILVLAAAITGHRILQ